ncbi:hypothetical protein [Haladaptatus sp. GCM10025707]|uniref:hypothetical protein n=1 Tax=Haladaptatus sp. GCM10025707 TaxID=3252658 RepID=UPI0036F20113
MPLAVVTVVVSAVGVVPSGLPLMPPRHPAKTTSTSNPAATGARAIALCRRSGHITLLA